MLIGALRRTAPRPVLLVTAVVAAVIMGDSMIYNVLPSNVSSFGVSVGLVGVLLSANRVVRVVSNPLAAWVLQRFGMGRPLLVSAVVAMATTVALGLGHGIGVLLAARILWGMCYSVFRLSGFMLVLEDGQELGRGRLMGVFNGGQRLGSVVGVLLGGVLFDVVGRRASFLIIAALGLLSLPAVLGLARHSNARVPESKGPVAKGEREGRVEGLRVRVWDVLLSSASEMGPVTRRRLLAVNSMFFSFYLIVSGLLVATLGYYLGQRLGDEAAIGGLVLGIATINGLVLASRWISDVGSPLLGHLGDRFGLERVVLVTVPVCWVALLLLALEAPMWVVLAWLPVTFIATAASMTVLSALAGLLAPASRRAQVMSRHATWQDVGSAAGPLVAYAALTTFSLEPVYFGGAAVMAAALAFFVVSFGLGMKVGGLDDSKA